MDTSRHCGRGAAEYSRPDRRAGAQWRTRLEKVPAGIEAEAVRFRGRRRGEESSEPLADDGDESEVKAEHMEPMDTSDRHDVGRRSRSGSRAQSSTWEATGEVTGAPTQGKRGRARGDWVGRRARGE